MKNIEKVLEEKGLRYKESDFWDNSVVGAEIVRFDWYNPKYKGHFKTVKGIKHFDDFIMEELKFIADKNQTLNGCCKLGV